ncbi:hypothetical protein SDC9_204974 [bioreactor metagenome]|uniref:Uncharacterized protein n=1 Tax=bioreactor metagenome TaxID=1076179 RepID=A0A645J280_9ZZZZ
MKFKAAWYMTNLKINLPMNKIHTAFGFEKSMLISHLIRYCYFINPINLLILLQFSSLVNTSRSLKATSKEVDGLKEVIIFLSTTIGSSAITSALKSASCFCLYPLDKL